MTWGRTLYWFRVMVLFFLGSEIALVASVFVAVIFGKALLLLLFLLLLLLLQLLLLLLLLLYTTMEKEGVYIWSRHSYESNSVQCLRYKL